MADRPTPSNVKIRPAAPRVGSKVQIVESGSRGRPDTTTVTVIPKEADAPQGPGVQMYKRADDGKMVPIDAAGNPQPDTTKPADAKPLSTDAVIAPQSGELAKVAAQAADAASKLPEGL